ncbi:DUF2785 domain-containing protein [Mycoplasmatota bacterium WC44]
MKKEVLKNALIKVKGNNDINNDEVTKLTKYMLENIGSIDFELRDNLIYSQFANWVLNDKYTKEQMKELLFQVFNEDKLFYKIGESNSDSVFTRTFSVLIIPLILYKNLIDGFLTVEEILTVYDNTKKYFKLEKDYRGYVVDKGWAHSVAHCADAFHQLVKYEVIDLTKQIEILEMIREKVQVNHIVYEQAEDERLVVIILEMLNRNTLSIIEFEKWINSIKEYPKSNKYPEDGILELNVKTFLRALYFKLIDIDDHAEIINHLKNRLGN